MRTSRNFYSRYINKNSYVATLIPLGLIVFSLFLYFGRFDNSIFFNNLIYNVLSITNYDNNIFILLNDNKIITLEAYNWSCLLEDVGKPKWPAVTPSHLRND